MARNTSRYVELARGIKQRIERGTYSGIMPGVHRLGKELGVNPKTVQRAMDLLVAEGRLYRPNPRSSGCRRRARRCRAWKLSEGVRPFSRRNRRQRQCLAAPRAGRSRSRATGLNETPVLPALAGAVALMAAPGWSAFAALSTYTWDGDTDNSWSNAANWDAAPVSGADTEAKFPVVAGSVTPDQDACGTGRIILAFRDVKVYESRPARRAPALHCPFEESTMMPLGIAAAFVLVLLASCCWAAGVDGFTPEYVRDQMPLHGQWECLHEHGDQEMWKPAVAAAAGRWRPIPLPGVVQPGISREQLVATKFVWARKRFDLTAKQAARDAVLCWGGIRFGAAAWINGTKVAEHAPIGPHAAILPAGVLKAGRNELLLRIAGWEGVPKSASGYPLVPTGASTQSWGAKAPAIEDDIWLDFFDGLYVKHALAMPDVAASTVTFRIWLDGPAPLPKQVELAARVLPDGTKTVAGQQMLDVAVGEKPIEITVPVKDAKPWTPQQCNLYTADLAAARDGKQLDAVRFRFGMRQIRVEGGHYRLNGGPLWLRGSNLVNEWHWGGRDGIFNQKTKTYVVDEARAMSLNCFRTHTCPPPASWLNVCDENGTMIWAELPVLYNYRDFKFTPAEREVFHRNALLDATGWVTKLWNHPSVVMWVLSNESRGDIPWESGAYHDHVVALDPTRPTMRTGCSVGTAENVDLHTCGNVTSGSEGSHILTCQAAARHKDPKRTLTNSEYMNFLGPADQVYTRLAGDADSPAARMAYAELGMEHTEALRRLRYDGILPYMYAGWTGLRTGQQWRPEFPTPMAAALHSSMAPVLASLDLFDRNFLTGQTVTTPLALINETRSDAPATLEVCVTPRHPQLAPDEAALKAAVWRESREVTFKADSLETIELQWPVPKDEGLYYLAAVVRRAGERPVVSQREVHAIDPARTGAGLKRPRVLLLGGSQVIERWLRDGEVEFATDLPADQVKADVVLVWDADRVGEAQRQQADALRRFAAAGGRIVVLAHASWGWKQLADLSIREREASRAFAYPDAKHPALTGIEPPFLMRWNGLPGRIGQGHFTGGEALKSARRLVWTAAPDQPAMISVPVGKGEMVFCQLMLRARISRGTATYDPVAERLLWNLIAR